MSEYSPPNTQNPIFDPQAWVPRSISDSTASTDVTSLINQTQTAYDTSKIINLALSQSSVVNVAYTAYVGCTTGTQYSPLYLNLSAGSYIISGNILVNATTNTNWTSIYLFGVFNGEASPQQGIQFSNNSQSGGMNQVFVPFSFYYSPIAGSTADIPFLLAVQLNGGTGTYTIGPAIGNDISICKIIGPNPYLGNIPTI